MALVGVRELFFERGCDDAQLGPSLGKRKTLPQPANTREKSDRAVAQCIPLLRREDLLRHRRRDPHIGAKNRIDTFKTFGPDTDNGERGAIELDRSPKNVRGAAKATLPSRIAEYGDGRRAWRGVLGRKEEPAHGGVNA